jgi:hypothetical protein
MRSRGDLVPNGLEPHRHPTLQQEGADLIDDGGALADQPLAHPVQRLQVELISSLGGNELPGRALRRLSDRRRRGSRSFVPCCTDARISPRTMSSEVAATISEKRARQSWPLRGNSRTRSPARHAIMRKPSCLISCSHCGPDGG